MVMCHSIITAENEIGSACSIDGNSEQLPENFWTYENLSLKMWCRGERCGKILIYSG
jgi:hypothetical protein